MKRPSPHSHGFVLSTEVLMATMLLFGSLLVISNLTSMQENRPSAMPQLRYYAQDTLRAGMISRTWQKAVFENDDDPVHNLVGTLPPGVCVQVKIYAGPPAANLISYSYIRPGCRRELDTPTSRALQLMVTNPRLLGGAFPPPIQIPDYWVQTEAYPSGG